MIPGIDPTVDYAFKRLFGLERSVSILKHMLNAVLQRWHHSLVTHLDLLNPFNEKETTDDKLSVVDLKARDQQGRHFNVEMQMLSNWIFPNRVLYYWSRLHALQLHEGQDFRELQPTISICFLNDILNRERPEYQFCFRLGEDQHPNLIFSPHLEIHLFELPKFQLQPEVLDTPLEKWLYFLRHAAILDTDKLPPSLQVPEIQQAFEELVMVTQSDRDRAKYEERFKAELDARSFKPVLLEEGRREGLARKHSSAAVRHAKNPGNLAWRTAADECLPWPWAWWSESICANSFYGNSKPPRTNCWLYLIRNYKCLLNVLANRRSVICVQPTAPLNLDLPAVEENLWAPSGFGVNHGDAKRPRSRQIRGAVQSRTRCPEFQACPFGRRASRGQLSWPYQTLSKVVAATRIVQGRSVGSYR